VPKHLDMQETLAALDTLEPFRTTELARPA